MVVFVRMPVVIMMMLMSMRMSVLVFLMVVVVFMLVFVMVLVNLMFMGVFVRMFMHVLIFFDTMDSNVRVGAFDAALDALFEFICDIRNAK